MAGSPCAKRFSTPHAPGGQDGYDGPPPRGRRRQVRAGTTGAGMIEPLGLGPMRLPGPGREIPHDCQPENLGISELMVPTSAAPRNGEEPWQ
jgi:hypothetical protein